MPLYNPNGPWKNPRKRRKRRLQQQTRPQESAKQEKNSLTQGPGQEKKEKEGFFDKTIKLISGLGTLIHGSKTINISFNFNSQKKDNDKQ